MIGVLPLKHKHNASFAQPSPLNTSLSFLTLSLPSILTSLVPHARRRRTRVSSSGPPCDRCCEAIVLPRCGLGLSERTRIAPVSRCFERSARDVDNYDRTSFLSLDSRRIAACGRLQSTRESFPPHRTTRSRQPCPRRCRWRALSRVVVSCTKSAMPSLTSQALTECH